MAKKKLNPMERALAQADNIIAANNELERVSRGSGQHPAPKQRTDSVKRKSTEPTSELIQHGDLYNDRRSPGAH